MICQLLVCVILEGKLYWVSFLCMSRPRAFWNATIFCIPLCIAFMHLLLGAYALPFTGACALYFKGVLLTPQQRLLFKANNYNIWYAKSHKIIIANSIFFPYLFRKKVDLKFTSNVKLHCQNTFVIKKMYRFSNTREQFFLFLLFSSLCEVGKSSNSWSQVGNLSWHPT